MSDPMFGRWCYRHHPKDWDLCDIGCVVSNEEVLMVTSDKAQQPAKPTRHEKNHPDQKKLYEHEEITDNRLVWEVLEEGENNASQ